MNTILSMSPEVTRAIVEAEYDVNDFGVITTPGKFVQESWIAPIVYDWMLDGSYGDELSDGTILYTLDDAERKMFGTDAYGVSLYISDQGFVSVSELTEEEYNQAIEDDEPEEEFEEDD